MGMGMGKEPEHGLGQQRQVLFTLGDTKACISHAAHHHCAAQTDQDAQADTTVERLKLKTFE